MRQITWLFYKMIYKKHFSLQEARNLLPQLKHKLQIIRNFTLELKAAGFDIYTGKYRPGFHPDTNEEYPSKYLEIKSLVKNIYDLGIEIKELEQEA